MNRLLAVLSVALVAACTNVSAPETPTQPPPATSAPTIRSTSPPATAAATPTLAPTPSPSPSPTPAPTPDPTATVASSPPTEPTPTSITSPAAGSPLEQLLAHVPEGMRQECHEVSSFDGGFVVGVLCSPDSIDGYVTYYLFDTAENMNASYESNAAFFGSDATGETCATEASEGGYTIDGTPSGRLMCNEYDTGYIAYWTHDDTNIESSIVLHTGTFADLWAAWQVAGPDPVAGQPTPAPQLTPVPATWATNATPFRGLIGQRFEFVCPPGGAAQTIWGTDIYTDDSAVCTAGVHVGVIDLVTAGTVTIEMRPGESSYAGSTRNDVISLNYGTWNSSYVVVTP